jgi:hypothetical protein
MAAFLLSITRSRIDVPGCQPTFFHGISALTMLLPANIAATMLVPEVKD